MTPPVRNLFTVPLPDGDGEVFEQLLEGTFFRMEAITSRGTPSAQGFWYDQYHPEWVLLVRGRACLEFVGSSMIDLVSGDYVLIPAGCRHRVASVSADAVWLALHGGAATAQRVD